MHSLISELVINLDGQLVSVSFHHKLAETFRLEVWHRAPQGPHSCRLSHRTPCPPGYCPRCVVASHKLTRVTVELNPSLTQDLSKRGRSRWRESWRNTWGSGTASEERLPLFCPDWLWCFPSGRESWDTGNRTRLVNSPIIYTLTFGRRSISWLFSFIFVVSCDKMADKDMSNLQSGGRYSQWTRLRYYKLKERNHIVISCGSTAGKSQCDVIVLIPF